LAYLRGATPVQCSFPPSQTTMQAVQLMTPGACGLAQSTQLTGVEKGRVFALGTMCAEYPLRLWAQISVTPSAKALRDILARPP